MTNNNNNNECLCATIVKCAHCTATKRPFACIATLRRTKQKAKKEREKNTRNYEKYTNKQKTIRNINDIKMNDDYCGRNCARHTHTDSQ